MSKQSQLQTWSEYQQKDILTDTYNSVKNAILEFKLPDNNYFADPYLQGSYGNDTHIYSKSDIDIVVELKSAFRSNLTDEARKRLLSAEYTLNQFVDDLYNFLIEKYGINYVEIGSKTIKINDTNNRKAVDVVPCIEYRHYTDPSNINSEHFKGISLKNYIYNFPKIHKENGVSKMSSTNSMYKKYIRIFKNFRKKVGDEFPSYFIECLLYNVPNDKFDTVLTEGFVKITNWLNSKNDKSNFISQNGIIKLFGAKSTQWQESDANDFIRKCVSEYEKL